ncbi:MAG: hypothetical protein WKF59_04415 [Chitinophagaceae bacterium]
MEAKHLQSVPTPHGDHHDLWIDPEDANRMIVADDGGGQVSFDGGDKLEHLFKPANCTDLQGINR